MSILATKTLLRKAILAFTSGDKLNIADTIVAGGFSSGTWTPVLTFATAGDLSVSYTTQTGAYIKIGDLVVVTFDILTSAFTHTTASGRIHVTGLPFTSASAASNLARGAVAFRGFTDADQGHMTALVMNNSALARFNKSGSGVGLADVIAADMPTGGTVIFESTISYKSA